MSLSPNISISVSNLSRLYLLFNRPQDRLKHAIWRGKRKFYTEFWALKNIFLEVKKGESVGIIGRNGSGKSTLLQIIAGVLRPSEGEVLVRGRVSALLELGSGLNHELTGRENIYLTGSILGLSETEINNKFDDIAAFADIGNFINQPIKLYSSGMVIRLAYSILAHLDPDILIIDEALAVGDVLFQLKCMRHIKKLIENGTTLLFVSHDPYTIKNLCKRSLWLHEGVSKHFGDSLETTSRYQDFLKESDKNLSAKKPDESMAKEVKTKSEKSSSLSTTKKNFNAGGGKSQFCRLISHKILDKNNNVITEIRRGETVKVCVKYEVYEDIGSISSGVAILDSADILVCGTNTHLLQYPLPSTVGKHGYEVIYNNLNLFPGTYKFDIGFFNENAMVFLDYHKHCLKLRILDNKHVGEGLVMLDHEYIVTE